MAGVATGGGEEAEDDGRANVHASCVSLGPRALLLTGAAGAGKSGVALQLMAWGGRLIADDRTLLHRRAAGIWASCPPSIAGRIEARGIGILAAEAIAGAWLSAVVDLDRDETERLPPRRTITLLGCELPLILNGAGLPFVAGLVQYLKAGRCL